MRSVRLTDVLRTSGLRVAVPFLLLFGASFLALIALVYWQTDHYLTHQADEWLEREVYGLMHETPKQRIEYLTEHVGNDFVHRRPFVLFDATGHPLVGEAITYPKEAAHGSPTTLYLTVKGRTELFRGIIIDLPEGQSLLVAENMRSTRRFRRELIGAMAIGSAVIFIFALIVAFFLGWSATRRIDRMTLTIRRIVAGQLSDRLPRNGRLDDIDRLGDVVNEMLDDIERLVHEVKGVCDGIAHDLRTPLTRLLGSLERMRRRPENIDALLDGLDGAIEETNGILARFSAMLRISEVEDGARRSGFRRIDLVDVVRDATDYYEPLAAARDVGLPPCHGAAAPINGDPSLVFDAVGNLIDNAVKASPAGASIDVRVETQDHRRWIEVVDAGRGIAADQREAVLRRFHRLDGDRHQQGSGLGLSLVSAIARLHGMSLTISDAGPSAGAPGCRVVLAVDDAAPVSA